MIGTPGHSDDHISPLFCNEQNYCICYFGEAFGINLRKDLHPIPASSAPDFNSEKYIRSINKLLNLQPKINAAIFSHFGGINGIENVKRTGLNAILQYQRFKDSILKLYSKKPSIRYITDRIFKIYSDNLVTRTINLKLAKNLTFTMVYGILLDEGLRTL
ncbi:MAG: hypothetical protein ACTSWY_09915 [Promethearchaeota archaeon]